MSEFILPQFGKRSLEVRSSGDEVAIYTTTEGLEILITLLNKLRDAGPKDSPHIHIEDYEMLTPESLRLVIALFENVSQPSQ